VDAWTQLKSVVKRVPIVGPALRDAKKRRARRRVAFSYFGARLQAIDEWLASSNEVTNFTYDLTELNLAYLTAFIANVTGRTPVEIRAYADELLTDRKLADHIARRTNEAPPELRRVSDPGARFGRRIGWYAIVRAMKPSLVVETGVEKGLGSCVVAAALLRNEAEGRPGRHLGTDIDPTAGWLLGEPYSRVAAVLRGDSQESLRKIEGPIGVFINDSDHSAAYERGEYEIVSSKLAPDAIVLGDNAHTNPELFEFAERTGRHFLFFQEAPKDHWYPGAGIGAAFGRASVASGRG
jgi:predicted O-methyltransferase YrrM